MKRPQSEIEFPPSETALKKANSLRKSELELRSRALIDICRISLLFCDFVKAEMYKLELKKTLKQITETQQRRRH